MNTLKTIAANRHTIFVILLCGLLFRAFNIDALAAIVDETGHLLESVNYSMYAPLDRLLSGKYLGFLLYKPIYLLFWNPLYVARLFTSLASVVAAYYVYLITRQLCSHNAGLAATVCYLVSPFTYFHDRQAIFDPIATVFFAVSLYCFLLGLRKDYCLIAAGLLFILGLSVKIYLLAGLPFFVILYVITRYFGRTDINDGQIPDIKRTLTLFLTGCGASIIVLLLIAPTPGQPNINLSKTAGQLSHFLLQQHGQSRKLSDIPLAIVGSGNSLISEYFSYAGAAAAAFVLLALVNSIFRRQHRWVSLIIITFASFYFYGVLTYVFNRYTHFLQIPVSIFSGALVAIAFDRFRHSVTRPTTWSDRLKTVFTIERWTVLLFLIMILDQSYVSTRIMHNPYYRIAPSDRFVYELGWPNAIGIDEVASTLKDISLKSDRKIHVVTIGWGMHSVWTLPLVLRGSGHQITFYHGWIQSEWQRENLREIMKTSRVLFLLEHPVAFINQKELLRIGSTTRVLFTYHKKEPSSYYELIELMP